MLRTFLLLVFPFCESFRKTEEEGKYKTLLNLRHLLAQISSRVDISSDVAGEEGLEPPNARTKTWCLTTWPLPIVEA
jgi:hypothetical protein